MPPGCHLALLFSWIEITAAQTGLQLLLHHQQWYLLTQAVIAYTDSCCWQCTTGITIPEPF